jgi:hypothetical protein
MSTSGIYNIATFNVTLHRTMPGDVAAMALKFKSKYLPKRILVCPERLLSPWSNYWS